MAGTMTMASALPGGIATASRLTDTVGKPRPITPLTKPANRKMAAITTRNGSMFIMRGTLTNPRRRHNLEVTELAFGWAEGRGRRHGAVRSRRPATFHRGGRCAQHHPWRGPRPSGARLRERADQGPGRGARGRLVQTRPPWRRT